MTNLRAGRPAERRAWRRAPGPPVRAAGGPVELPAAPRDGVELARLLVLARLSPRQAVEIGAGVLADAVRRPPPAGGSPATVRVVVDAGGAVQLHPVPDPAGRRSPVDGRGGATLETVLAELAAAARPAGHRPDPGTERLVTALDRAAADLPVAGAAAVARRLQEAAAALDRTAVRAELAALVQAVDGTAGADSGSRPAGAPAAAARAAAAGRAGSGRSGTARRRIGAWLLSALVLGGVVVVEVAVLRDKIATDVGLLLDAGRSGASPSDEPEPDGLPIPLPAPATAGPVAAVDLRALTECAPGAPCTVRVLVRLEPAAQPRMVTWSYRLVDRCTGAATTAPGGTVTVPPGGTQATAVGTVDLPAVPAVAVVAVTELPAVAAGPPVLTGSCLPARAAP